MCVRSLKYRAYLVLETVCVRVRLYRGVEDDMALENAKWEVRINVPNRKYTTKYNTYRKESCEKQKSSKKNMSHAKQRSSLKSQHNGTKDLRSAAKQERHHEGVGEADLGSVHNSVTDTPHNREETRVMRTHTLAVVGQNGIDEGHDGMCAVTVGLERLRTGCLS